MQRPHGSWLALVACVAAALASPIQAGDEVTCPPQEQAVLEAYAAWATFLTERGEARAARKATKSATKLRGVCAATKSAFTGVDPVEDLLGFAQKLAESGRLDEARRIEPVARAYAEDQIVRLTMHGGQVIDPARYYGRPADYERRRPGIGKVGQSTEGTGYKAFMPPGGGWRVSAGRESVNLSPGTPSHEYLAFSKDPSWMARRPAPGQSLVLVVLVDPYPFTREVSAEEFPSALEANWRENLVGRFRLAAVTATHRGTPGDYCANYVVAVEERDNPQFPEVVLETSQRGLACLDASSKYVVDAYYSERRPQGEPSVIDDVIRQEAEAFLRDLELTPRREGTKPP